MVYKELHLSSFHIDDVDTNTKGPQTLPISLNPGGPTGSTLTPVGYLQFEPGFLPAYDSSEIVDHGISFDWR